MSVMRGFILAMALVIGLVAGRPGRADPSPPAKDGVLALHAPWSGPRLDWYVTSLDDGDTGKAVSRIRGDAFSKFYYLVRGDVTEVRTEEGRLLARLASDEDILGIGKAPTSLTLIQYHAAAEAPDRYELTFIERGSARVYRCRVDQSTLDAVAGRHDPRHNPIVDGSAYRMIRSLEEARPALARDHCVAIGNGVRRGRDAAPRPVLTVPFPHVGDRFLPDERGLKGGWIYQGTDPFGRNRSSCCALTYEREGQLALIITNARRRGYRVEQIVHVDRFSRLSTQCEIDGEPAVIAVADAAWKNGRAYLTDGKAVRIVRWTDRPPPHCAAVEGS